MYLLRAPGKGSTLMKVACPSCGTGGSIALFIADADARKAVLEAARLPSDCGTWVLKYMTLFSPRERFLSTSRGTRIIADCCTMIVDGVIFERARLTAPSYIWREALMDVCHSQSITRPLKHHHYLLRVVQSKLQQRHEPVTIDAPPVDRRGESRLSTGMKKVGEVLDIPQESAPELPCLPGRGEEARWLDRAKEAMLKEGFHRNFLPEDLVMLKAREMYAETLQEREVSA